jgi:hypothetical protein
VPIVGSTANSRAFVGSTAKWCIKLSSCAAYLKYKGNIMSLFIDRLKQLLKMKPNTRYNTPDWKEMVSLLKKEGHWKRKPSGRLFTKYGKRPKIIVEDEFGTNFY